MKQKNPMYQSSNSTTTHSDQSNNDHIHSSGDMSDLNVVKLQHQYGGLLD